MKGDLHDQSEFYRGGEVMETTAKEGGSTAPWWWLLIEGLVIVLLGIILVAYPGMSTALLVQILGIYVLIKGVLSIVNIFIDNSRWGWKILVGIVGIVLGILVIQNPLWSALLVTATAFIAIGIGAITMGVINLIEAFRGAGWGTGILGVVIILVGVVVLLSPSISPTLVPNILGLFLIVGGIMAIINAFRRR
jgi:uncharacterized membrane protein HdeD (DUF308 family)